MTHRLTDYDHAVLAAAKIGALKREGKVWFMGGVNCMLSLYRLEQADEVYIAHNGDILFPGTEQYAKAEKHAELRAAFISGVRNGTIKVLVDKPTKKIKGFKINLPKTKGPKT